jgi:hypothetical protein
MKVLVAVMSCHKYEYYVAQNNIDWFDGVRKLVDPAAQRQACRDTWLSELPEEWDYRFFMGKQFPRRDRDIRHFKTPTIPEALSDEVLLDVDDTYRGNGFKLHAICRWALDRGYDYIFRADDDTMLWMDRISRVGFEKYDYTGNCLPDGRDPGVHAGFAVFLSRRLMELVVREAPSYEYWCDDVWVGDIARENRIPTNPVMSIQTRLGLDNRRDYYINTAVLPIDHSYAALHSATPEIMREIFNREKEIKNASNTQQECKLPERSQRTDPGSTDISTEHCPGERSIESGSGGPDCDDRRVHDGESGGSDTAVSCEVGGDLGVTAG